MFYFTFSLTNVSAATECLESNTVITIVKSVKDQIQLDLFLEKLVSYDSQIAKCIQLSLAGNEFTLDIVQLMRTNVTKLILTGDGIINCTANAADMDTLRNTLQPISRALLVVFDGLTFNKCPVPILIEEVAVVMILNCLFM